MQVARTTKGDRIILEPIREIPSNEQWLFEPENKEILTQVKKGLRQKGDVDLGPFQAYLDISNSEN